MAATNNLGPQWQPVPLVGHGNSLPWDPQGVAHSEGPNGELVTSPTLFDHHLRPNWQTVNGVAADSLPYVPEEAIRPDIDAAKAINDADMHAEGRTARTPLESRTKKIIEGIRHAKGLEDSPAGERARLLLANQVDGRKLRESKLGDNRWGEEGNDRSIYDEVADNGIQYPLHYGPTPAGDSKRYFRYNGNHRAVAAEDLADRGVRSGDELVPILHAKSYEASQTLPRFETTPEGAVTLHRGKRPEELTRPENRPG